MNNRQKILFYRFKGGTARLLDDLTSKWETAVTRLYWLWRLVWLFYPIMGNKRLTLDRPRPRSSPWNFL